MCPSQFEIRLFIVFKNPYPPIVGVMAVPAHRSQCRFVLIVVLVAGIAF